MASMETYVSDTVESYKDIIIGYLGSVGTSYLSFHIIQCWRVYAVDEYNQAPTVVIYC